MSLLAAAKAQLYADLHVITKKVDRMIQFCAEIVVLDGRGELYLLDSIPGLVAAGLFGSFCLFVKKLSVVDDAADRGRGVRRDLDEIQVLIPGEAKRHVQSQDPELLFGLINNPHFAGANLSVSAMKRFAGKGSSKRATQ